MENKIFFNLKTSLIIAFVFLTQLTFGQEIVIEKEIIENTINCRQFDVKNIFIYYCLIATVHKVP